MALPPVLMNASGRRPPAAGTFRREVPLGGVPVTLLELQAAVAAGRAEAACERAAAELDAGMVKTVAVASHVGMWYKQHMTRRQKDINCNHWSFSQSCNDFGVGSFPLAPRFKHSISEPGGKEAVLSIEASIAHNAAGV
jgi:hypothetical protein